MKIGQKQPCPCGSGKQYRMCCRTAHQDARRAEQHRNQVQAMGTAAADLGAVDRLDELSNGVLDVIAAGRLDDAEKMCNELLTEFSEMIDGHMRLGALCRVRGDAKKAAEHMRLAAAMARAPDFEPEVAIGLDAEADAIDPPSS